MIARRSHVTALGMVGLALLGAADAFVPTAFIPPTGPTNALRPHNTELMATKPDEMSAWKPFLSTIAASCIAAAAAAAPSVASANEYRCPPEGNAPSEISFNFDYKDDYKVEYTPNYQGMTQFYPTSGYAHGKEKGLFTIDPSNQGGATGATISVNRRSDGKRMGVWNDMSFVYVDPKAPGKPILRPDWNCPK